MSSVMEEIMSLPSYDDFMWSEEGRDQNIGLACLRVSREVIELLGREALLSLLVSHPSLPEDAKCVCWLGATIDASRLLFFSSKMFPPVSEGQLPPTFSLGFIKTTSEDGESVIEGDSNGLIWESRTGNFTKINRGGVELNAIASVQCPKCWFPQTTLNIDKVQGGDTVHVSVKCRRCNSETMLEDRYRLMEPILKRKTGK